jgi:molybdenum cofactor cytidylyltransferase
MTSGTDSPASCAAVVLAAGEARRFGAQKLLMPFDDSTVIGSVIAGLAAAGAAPIIVVVGRDAEEIAAAVGKRAQVVRNPDPARGMLSSIQTGVAALPAEVSRFLIALGDQPRLRPADVVAVLAAQQESGRGLAIPVYDGRRGHPIVVSRVYRRAILELGAQQTLRDLVRARHYDCVEVVCDSDAVVSDIDTREQYQDELRRALAERDPRAVR